MLYKAIFNFHSEDKTPKCDHSCEHYKAAYCDALQPSFNLKPSIPKRQTGKMYLGTTRAVFHTKTLTTYVVTELMKSSDMNNTVMATYLTFSIHMSEFKTSPIPRPGYFHEIVVLEALLPIFMFQIDAIRWKFFLATKANIKCK